MDYSTSKIALNDTGDRVSLKAPDGSVVDTVTYDEQAGKSEGKTWARLSTSPVTYGIRDPTKGEKNTKAEESESLSPAPSPTTPQQSIAGVQLSEIMACPGPHETEWIELYNPTSGDIEEVPAKN